MTPDDAQVVEKGWKQSKDVRPVQSLDVNVSVSQAPPPSGQSLSVSCICMSAVVSALAEARGSQGVSAAADVLPKAFAVTPSASKPSWRELVDS